MQECNFEKVSNSFRTFIFSHISGLIFHNLSNHNFRIVKLKKHGKGDVNEGETVIFKCEVNANPLDNTTVKWGKSRDTFDFSRASFSYNGKDTYEMTIKQVKKTDRGKFYLSGVPAIEPLLVCAGNPSFLVLLEVDTFEMI